MNVVSREQWGAKPATGSTRLNPNRVTMFVLHHTTGTYAGPVTVRNIQSFHQGKARKWADVAYNFLVAPDGIIFEGRGWTTTGAHARGQNSTSIGVAYIGDGRLPVSAAAKTSIKWLADEADRKFGRLKRVGHTDVGSTVCPGSVLHSWWMSGAKTSKPKQPEPVIVQPEPVVEPDPFALKPSWVTKPEWSKLIAWVKDRR